MAAAWLAAWWAAGLLWAPLITQAKSTAGWMAGEYAIHHSLGPADYYEPDRSHMTSKGYIGGTIRILFRSAINRIPASRWPWWETVARKMVRLFG